jgi:hypothetical protein
VVSVMAMLYLVIFSVMALGFYAATTTAGQVAANERTSIAAQLAAESGFQFLRYHLSALEIPGTTKPDRVLDEVYQQLAKRLDPTVNLGGSVVGYDDGKTVMIPKTGYVRIDPAGSQKFKIALTTAGDLLVATVVGRGGNVSLGRALEIRFQKATNASAIFNYGVAARGPVTMSGNVKIQGSGDPTKGSLLSATDSQVPLTTSGNTTISGDLSYTNNLSPSYSGTTSIGGFLKGTAGFAQHVHAGVEAPEFPVIDSSVYLPFCTNTWTAASGTSNVNLVNCVIPSSASPITFSGNSTIKGILYIKTPNKVSFSGNLNIQGCIVVENNPTGLSNTLAFSGNVTASGIDTLPANATYPASERALTGAFLLAPTFAVTFSGNFGTIGGSMIADKFTFSGNAGGTIRGSVIALKDVPMSISGNSAITIASAGTTEYPPGVTFGSHYASIPGSYLEVPMP